MTYIFLDESGDLGFGKRSTRWFAITVAITSDFRSLERCVKKVWRSLPEKYKKYGELHASYHNSRARKRMIKSLSRVDDLKIMYVAINKENIPDSMKKDTEGLYSYATYVLLEKAQSMGVIIDGDHIELYADKRSTKKQSDRYFVKCINESMKKNMDMPISISLVVSNDNKSLQAVDFISWAIFRKYERQEDELYGLISAKIVSEQILYQ